jgi:hypothetical protein
MEFIEFVGFIINQRLDGNCRLYYEPGSSVRGALLCAERPIKRARASEVVREELILSRKFSGRYFKLVMIESN